MTNPIEALLKTLQTANDNYLIDLHTALPVEVIAVDYTTQTVDCKIVVKRIATDDEVLEFDTLTEVPIGYTQTNQFGITFPINVGDTGQVIFNERQLDNWVVNDEIVQPDDTRKHSLSDGLFLPNFVNRQNLIPSINQSNLEIKTKDGNGKIYITPNGKIEIQRGSNKVFEILSNALDVLGRSTCTVTGGSSAGTYNIDQQSEWTALKNLIDEVRA